MKKKSDLNKILISVIVPIFNEEDIIELFYQSALKLIQSNKNINYEFLMIDNGSQDQTIHFLKKFSKKKEFKLIELSNYFGKESAILCGLDESRGDYAVIIDPDLEDPLELIPEMYKEMKKGFDIIYAKRSNKGYPFNFTNILKKYFYKIFEYFSDKNLKIYPDTGDFKMMKIKVAKDLSRMRENTRFNRALTSFVNKNVGHVEFNRKTRKKGKSKSNLPFLWKYGLNSIISSSSKPLEIWFYVGLLWFLFSIFLILFVFFKKIYGNSIEGWSSTLIILLFFSSFNSLSIGVLCIYLNRIYLEVKNRPQYVIRNKK